MAPADPGRADHPDRNAGGPAQVLRAAPGDCVRLLPGLVVDVRAASGLVLPAQRRLRGPCRARVRTLVSEHPEWEAEPFVSQFTADYGEYASVADVFRQIGHDERVHKQESEAQLGQPRFH